ncbi:hypothetical protein N452_09150 [Clostridium botulinum A2 117]|uniref:hypothetical protein n=1 Tax=Clostridium botulinum TaxID=1491 RepID=UPI0007E1EA54|nr:hypothetical protein [Clostridium botulinum]KEI78757.1 hypothetical protein N452_09150 [Clostridium botulinum A2 117]MBN3415973.1 hypothetical protein [Clostridium botulinum]MBN3442265.1 hypothetical protein [Clostridium botulinum]MBY6806314.1 hypothetical protein [Clostridium botulinum]
MKRLNIYRIVFIISLLILPIIILFNMNLNNKVSLVQEERNKLQLSFQNSNSIKSIDCTYILEKLSENPYVSVKKIENEKNNIYVSLNYYGDKEELKKFLSSVNSSKNFKSIKNLSMNTKKIENNNNGNHNRYDNESDEKINNNSDNNEEEQQTDITLQYAKKLN